MILWLLGMAFCVIIIISHSTGRPTVGQLLIPLIHILQLGDNVTIHCPPEHPHLNWCHANNAQSGGVDKNRTPCVEEGDLDHECAVESHMLTIHNLTEVFNMTVWYCTTADCNNLTGVNGRIHLLRLASESMSFLISISFYLCFKIKTSISV